jgi:hypothetical protein
MSNFQISTAFTAGRGRDPAVHQTANSSALRQGRQLRQGYSISCEESSVRGISRQSYIGAGAKHCRPCRPCRFVAISMGQRRQGIGGPPQELPNCRKTPHSGGASAGHGLPHLGHHISVSGQRTHLTPCACRFCSFSRHLRVSGVEAF